MRLIPLLILLLIPFAVYADTIVVPVGGNVQAAVSAAKCGDTVALIEGQSYPHAGRLTFTNTNRDCTDSSYITLSTNNLASIPKELTTAYPYSYRAATKSFTRLTSAMTAKMPKLISTTNDPIMFFEPGAHHWRFIGIEVTNADNGIQHTTFVNDGSTGVHDIPHHLIWDRMFFRPVEEVGDLTTNIALRSVEMCFIISMDYSAIVNSAIQGFTGHNKYPYGGQGPGKIRLNANSFLLGFGRNNVFENSLFESNGQIFLAGGGGVNPEHTAKATNVTLTSATFSNTKNLDVGDLFSIYSRRYSDNHMIQHPDAPEQEVARVGHYVTGKILTLDRATGKVTFTNLRGGVAYRWFNVRLWNATGGTWTLTWMGQTTAPIPYNATAAQVRAALEALPNVEPEDFYVRAGDSRGGGWPWGDYEIRFGFNENGQPSGQWQYPRPVNPMKMSFTSLTGYQYPPRVSVHSAESHSPVENSADGTLIDVPDEGANVQWKGHTSDNNVFRRIIVAHHPEWTRVTGSVKGFAEVKGGTRTIFDGVIFSGEGTTIIWTVRNQGDGCSTPWSEVSYSRVTNSLFDTSGYSNGFFLQDPACENVESHDILVSNTASINPDFTLPADYPWLYMVSGYNIKIDHNTVIAGGRLLTGISAGPSRNAIITNNLFEPAGYIAPCFDGPGPCWPNATVSNNVIGKNARTGAEQIPHWLATFGSASAWIVESINDVKFVNRAANDYRLSPDSPYRAGGPRQATDGKDVGVVWDEFFAAFSGSWMFDGSAPNPTPAPTPVATPTPAPTPATLTWEKLAGSPDAVQTLAFVGPVLYVGTMRNGIHAYDGTWRRVEAGLPSTPVWVGNFHVTRAGSLLASMRFSGMAQSSTWRLSGGVWVESSGARNEYATFYASDRGGNVLASTNTSSVQRSTDDGRTFQHFSTVPAVGGVGSSSFSIGAGVDGTIYLYSHDTGGFYSTDGGITWNSLGQSSGPWGNQTALTSNTQGQMVVATGFGGIYRNQGTLTSPSIQLETNLQVNNDTGAHSLIRLADSTLVSHFIRVHCSRDGGDTWVLCDTGIPAGTTSGAQNVQSLHTGDLAQGPDGRVYVGFVNAGMGVYRTVAGQVPAPSPTPIASPSPAPTPSPSNTLSIQGYVYAKNASGVDVRVGGAVVAAGSYTIESNSDGLFTMVDIPVNATITVVKAGYSFPSVSVVTTQPDQLYFINGQVVSEQPSPSPTPTQPPATPTPTPVSTPTPVATPTPAPTPAPPACTISVPDTVTLARNSTTTVMISVTAGSSPLPINVMAIAETGQVVVTPTRRPVTTTFPVSLPFVFRTKQNPSSVRWESPCGVKTTRVLIR